MMILNSEVGVDRTPKFRLVVHGHVCLLPGVAHGSLKVYPSCGAYYGSPKKRLIAPKV